MSIGNYAKSVFINCPFDPQYDDIFDAIVFAVQHAGMRARCAKEYADGANNRLSNISTIIEECKYGIHDISRIETTIVNGVSLPRFNMPLELGLFLGCKRFGDTRQQSKSCLILDSTPFRYRDFVSDIAGQDIHTHNNDAHEAIRVVCRWLSAVDKRRDIPGGAITIRRYTKFRNQLPRFYNALHKEPGDVVYVDYVNAITEWLRLNVLR